MTVQNFIKSVTEENDGFILNEAWRLNEDSLSVIIPVLRNSKAKRGYITLAEANDVKVEDTGQIDYVFIQNNEKQPLLISRGEIFRGKTQERAAIHGHIIMAGKGSRVAVRCIHQSKGINNGAEMKYGGRVPSDIDLSSQTKTWNSVSAYSCSADISRSSGQMSFTTSNNTSRIVADQVDGVMDNSINTVLTSSMGGGTPENAPEPDMAANTGNINHVRSSIPASDDLVDTLDGMSDMIKEMLKKIPPIKNQVGAVFLYENSVKGLDIYDLPDSWDAVKEDVVAKEGSDYLKKDDTNIFEFKPDKVKALLGKQLSGPFEEKVIYDRKDFRILEVREVKKDDKKTQLLGEAVEFQKKIIHLTMYQV